MMHPIFLCMVAGTVFGAGLSIATEPIQEPQQNAQPTLQELFRSADRNGDGMLDKSEVQIARLSSLVENFSSLDSDGDGFLTQAEVRPRLRPRLSA